MILSTPHTTRFWQAGIPDRKELHVRVLAWLREHPGGWDSRSVTRGVALHHDEHRRVVAALRALREKREVTSRKPVNGKGQYGLCDLEWWVPSEARRNA